MHIDLATLAKNSLFLLVVGALGSVLGALGKVWIDKRTDEAKRRQDSITHFFQQIEELAPSYYLMSNHAARLSSTLDDYLQTKRDQMAMLGSEQFAAKLVARNAETTAAEALFEAGMLHRVINDRFFVKGGDYVVPDRWANTALNGLNDQIMDLLTFDKNVLLRHIDGKTERQDFLAKLQSKDAEHSDQELHEQYALYQTWVLQNHGQVKLLAENAWAYSQLFHLQINRLYEGVWDQRQKHKGTDVDGLSADTWKLIEEADKKQDRLQTTLPALRDSDDLLSMGWDYQVRGQLDLAIREFEKAVSGNPANGAAQNSLGNAYTNKGAAEIAKGRDPQQHFQNAEKSYIQASTCDPANPVFLHNAGNLQMRRTNWNQAVVLFKEAIDRGTAAERPDLAQQALRHKDLGRALQANGDYQGAIEAFDTAISLRPFESVLFANMASAYLDKYRFDKSGEARDQALDAFSSAADLTTGDAAAAYQRQRAEICLEAKLWKDAETNYQRALDLNVSDGEKAETNYGLGQMYEQQGNWMAAAKYYLDALNAGGNFKSRDARSLIIALKQSGSVISDSLKQFAIESCLADIQKEPDKIAHHENLANIYYALNNLPRFQEERDTIVRMADDLQVDSNQRARYYNQLGYAYRLLGIFKMGLTYYDRAIALDDKPEYQRNKGLALQSLGRYNEAQQALDKAREGHEDDVDILLSTATVKASGPTPEDLESAIQLCRAASTKAPTRPDAHFFLGELLIRQGNFAEGMVEYRKGRDLTIADETRRTPWQSATVKEFDAAIQAVPDRMETQFWRAQLLFELGQLPDAEAGFLKARQLAGDRKLELISIEDGLGEVYFRTDKQKAVEAWERAQALGKTLSPEERATLSKATLSSINLDRITNNLGTAYDALGQKDKALECYSDTALKSPTVSVAHYNLARALYARQEYAEALSEFQETLRLHPWPDLSRRALFCIGNCSFRLGWADIPMEKWKEIATPGFAYPEAQYNIGVYLWLQKQEDEAARYWDDILKSNPSMLDAEYNLGVFCILRGRVSDGLNHWRSIIGKPGFESLQSTIDQVEKGEKVDFKIRDIGDI